MRRGLCVGRWDYAPWRRDDRAKSSGVLPLASERLNIRRWTSSGIPPCSDHAAAKPLLVATKLNLRRGLGLCQIRAEVPRITPVKFRVIHQLGRCIGLRAGRPLVFVVSVVS